MNQQYGSYGSYGFDWSALDPSAALASLATQAQSAAGTAAGALIGGAYNYAQVAKTKAAYALWCRTHPIACFFEKHPWAKPALVGLGFLYVSFTIYNLYMLPRRVRRAAPYIRAAADAGLFGPEGMVASQSTRRLTTTKNAATKNARGQRRRSRRRSR